MSSGTAALHLAALAAILAFLVRFLPAHRALRIGANLCALGLIAIYTLAAFYAANKPDLAMAATLVADASRYGTIDFDPATQRLTAFREKRPGQGFINAGTYVVNAARLMSFDLPPKFSFEQHFLGKHVETLDIRVFPEVAEFIDIGIPADYERAQTVVPAMMEPRSSEA